MSKKVKTILKLQIEGGKANPAPPIGPILGQHGINIGKFCQEFNEATKDKIGQLTSVEVVVFEDNSLSFKLKSPPTSFLLKKAAGIEKGSAEPNKKKVGTISREQIIEIAQKKMEDLNTDDIERAIKIVEGTARNMGIDIK